MKKLSKNMTSYLNNLAANGPHIPRRINRRTRLALISRGLVVVTYKNNGPTLVYLTGEGADVVGGSPPWTAALANLDN